jgi:hypothetical protein
MLACPSLTVPVPASPRSRPARQRHTGVNVSALIGATCPLAGDRSLNPAGKVGVSTHEKRRGGS